MKAESDGGSIAGAQAAVGAEDEDFRAQQFLRLPAHAGVLAQTEKIAGGGGEQHFRGDGQKAARTGRVGRHVVQLEGAGFEDRCKRDGGNGFLLFFPIVVRQAAGTGAPHLQQHARICCGAKWPRWAALFQVEPH